MTFKKTLLISILIHSAILLPWFIWKKSPAPLAGGGGGANHETHVSVEIVGNAFQNRLRQAQATGLPKAQGTQTLGPGVGNGQGLGSGIDEGQDTTLTLIRSKIERAKRYPELAKRAGIAGNVLVSFHINNDGKAEDFLVKQTSGSKLLDDEAKATLERAAPYPIYSEPLEIWIKFEQTSD